MITITSVLMISQVNASTRDFSNVMPIAPASGERFTPTKKWLAIEQLAWETATEIGLTGWMRRIFMIIIWNETRGNPDPLPRGDNGCAMGLMQIHVGGFQTNGMIKCRNDNRKLLPKHLKLPKEYFLNPQINLEAGAYLLQRKRGKGTAFSASARYAGCKPEGKCAHMVWGRHHWWWITGLDKRIISLETMNRQGAT
jgi:hypothetical protein